MRACCISNTANFYFFAIVQLSCLAAMALPAWRGGSAGKGEQKVNPLKMYLGGIWCGIQGEEMVARFTDAGLPTPTHVWVVRGHYELLRISRI